MPTLTRTTRSGRVRVRTGALAAYCTICTTVTGQRAFTSGRRRRWQLAGPPVGDVRHYTVCDVCGYQAELPASGQGPSLT
jgi:hypothetical protein